MMPWYIILILVIGFLFGAALLTTAGVETHRYNVAKKDGSLFDILTELLLNGKEENKSVSNPAGSRAPPKKQAESYPHFLLSQNDYSSDYSESTLFVHEYLFDETGSEDDHSEKEEKKA